MIWTGVAGSPAYTNLYAVAAGPSVGALLSNVNALCTGLAPQIANAVTMTVEGDVAQIDTATRQIVGVTSGTTTTVAGSGSGVVPLADQILVRFLTGAYIGGRQVRGRLYIPYARSAAVNSATGLVASAVSTPIQTAIGAYLTSVGPAAVVYSPKNGTAVSISSANVWNQFAVQRSRRD